MIYCSRFQCHNTQTAVDGHFFVRIALSTAVNSTSTPYRAVKYVLCSVTRDNLCRNALQVHHSSSTISEKQSTNSSASLRHISSSGFHFDEQNKKWRLSAVRFYGIFWITGKSLLIRLKSYFWLFRLTFCLINRILSINISRHYLGL